MTPKKDESMSQTERFKQAARELGVELDEAKLKAALRKISPATKDPKAISPQSEEEQES